MGVLKSWDASSSGDLRLALREFIRGVQLKSTDIENEDV